MTDPTLAALTEALEALRWYSHAPDLDADIGLVARRVLPDMEAAVPALADLARKAEAVPALLEALETAQKGCGSVAWVLNNLHNYGNDDFRRLLVDAAIDANVGHDAARAAIAAALGEQGDA